MFYQILSKIWIVVIIAVLIAGGILAWWYLVPKEKVKAPEEVVIDETADWKIYRNKEWGFEVKYPPDWFVDDSCLYTEGCLFKFVKFGEKGVVLNYAGKEMLVEKIGFTVYRYEDVSELYMNEKETLPLERWVVKNFPPEEVGESIEVTTLGRENYKGILVKKYKEVGVVKIIHRAFIPKNSLIYKLEGEVPTIASIQVPTKYDYDKVFYQMLSTFKFLK